MYPFDLELLKRINSAVRDPIWEAREYSFPKQVETIWPTEASVAYMKDGVPIVEGACNRATWYRLNKYPATETIEDRMFWIWRVGKLLEDDINLLLKQENLLAARNVRFQDMSTGLPISGEMDAVCKFTDPTGQTVNFVVDVKTTGGNYFGVTQILGNTKTKPFPKVPNLLQIMVYLNVDPSLAFGKLVYLIRDNLVGNEFTIRLNEVNGSRVANIKSTVYNSSMPLIAAYGVDYPEYSIENIYNRFRELVIHYKNKTVPPPDYSIEYTDARAEELHRIGVLSDNQIKEHRKGKTKGDYQCIGCKFLEHCKKDR